MAGVGDGAGAGVAEWDARLEFLRALRYSSGMLERLRREWGALVHDDEHGATPHPQRVQVRQFLRFWVQVIRDFLNNRCASRASALAYSSLLAFVPLLAVVIGISTSVLKNDEARIRGRIDDLLENLVPQLMRSPDFAGEKDKIVGYILDAIASVQSGTLGTTGTIALLVMILFMLARVEETLNDIWGVPQGRSWYARMVNYWAAITLGPILMFAAIGFSTSLQLDQTQAWLKGGSTRVKADEIRDAGKLIHRLAAGSDAISRHLWGAFSEEATNRLAGSQAAGEPEARVVLARELTAAMRAGPLPSPSEIEGVTLSPRTAQLLAENPRGADRIRCNRFLLEDVFPEGLTRSGNGLPIVGSVLLWLVPIVVLGGACSLFYALMPNTRVEWMSALVGGGVAGVLWHLNNTLSVLFVSSNSSIYKGLAAVPVFMVGLYLFWLLLLFGAQVAYTFQNRHQYAAVREISRVHQAGRERIAVRIMTEAARSFMAGSEPPSVSALAETLEVPGQLISRVCTTLVETRLLSEVARDEASGLVPARPLDAIRVSDILDAMRRGLGSAMEVRGDAAGKVVDGELLRVAEAEERAGARTMADLVREFHAETREVRALS